MMSTPPLITVSLVDNTFCDHGGGALLRSLNSAERYDSSAATAAARSAPISATRAATGRTMQRHAASSARRCAFVCATATLRVNAIVKPCAAALATLLTMVHPIAPCHSLHALTPSSASSAHTPCFVFARAPPRAKAPEDAAERRRRKVLHEAYHVLRDRYVNDSQVNWVRLQRRLQQRSVDSDEKLHKTLQWLFSRCGDAFTRYLTPAQWASMKDDMDGEMCGVGIVFSAESGTWRRSRRMVVRQVVTNSPAEQGGIRTGDVITAIDMHKVCDMSVDEATARLLGKAGRKVLLAVIRDGTQIELMLTRRRFQVRSVWWHRVNVRDVGDVGYVQVREFAAHTAREVRAALRALERPQQRPLALYVLDLRGNSGGLVDRAVEVAKLFLPRREVVVQFVGREGTRSTERNGWRRGAHERKSTVVLVDADTASASELVAAALRDNCRGVLVGDSTFGKGSVQAMVSLSNGGGAAVTVGEYRTPRDERLRRGRGLRPSVRRGALADGERAVQQLFEGRGAMRATCVQARLSRCRAGARCE
eukprot:TRINITY_DN187_c0_g3_i1.p1 TRINITY_DN187_c0_g3~~TRINITY_DN187_c0_g3_i1.p1  ORF type:complete len:536 (-),score=104.19 TRINITY_DN187_c0_g3_i1:437-2044(-)